MTGTMAPAVRLVAAIRSGAHMVARPSGVAHIYSGPLTPSGASVPRARRAVCKTRTRRLGVLARPLPVELAGRRVCRRCMAVLPPSLGRDVVRLVTPEERRTAYDHLTIGDLTVAARWARTVEESHQVGGLALLLFDPPPVAPPKQLAKLEGEARDRRHLHDVLIARRQALRNAERTDEERATATAKREAAQFSDDVILAGRQKEGRIARAQQRQTRGQWLMPHERALLAGT